MIPEHSVAVTVLCTGGVPQRFHRDVIAALVASIPGVEQPADVVADSYRLIDTARYTGRYGRHCSTWRSSPIGEDSIRLSLLDPADDHGDQSYALAPVDDEMFVDRTRWTHLQHRVRLRDDDADGRADRVLAGLRLLTEEVRFLPCSESVRCRNRIDPRRRRTRSDRASGAVARDEHHPPRQPRTGGSVGRQGRRSPGLVGVDRHDHDGALLRRPARRGPGLGEAARSAGAPGDQLPARSARPRVPDRAAELRRAAELPQQDQGSRPGRLLDRVGRDRRDGDRSGARCPTATSAATSTTDRPGRHIALVGDAELDEGAAWEAIIDPMVAQLGELLWIVDLNRQSLDRVVPNIAAARMESMFAAAGWHTITLKYGRRLRAARRAPGRPSVLRSDRHDVERGVPATAALPEQRGARTARQRPSGGGAHRRRHRRRRAAGRSSATSAATTSRPARRLRRCRRVCATARRSSSPTRSRRGGLPVRRRPRQPLGAA